MFEKWKEKRRKKLLEDYERHLEWRKERSKRELSYNQMLDLAERVNDWHYADRRTSVGPNGSLYFLYENENLLTGCVGHLTLKFTKHSWYELLGYTIRFPGPDIREIDTMYYVSGYKKPMKALYREAKIQADDWVEAIIREWNKRRDRMQIDSVEKARSLLLHEKLNESE